MTFGWENFATKMSKVTLFSLYMCELFILLHRETLSVSDVKLCHPSFLLNVVDYPPIWSTDGRSFQKYTKDKRTEPNIIP